MSVIANRVKVAVDGTPGTGTIDLGAAVTGFQSFADGGVTNGQVVSYAIEDGDDWEIGTGTYTTGTPNTLSRTVIESSNSDAALDLSSNAVVFITALSGDLQNAVDMDQGVATTDSPAFAGLSVNSNPLPTAGSLSNRNKIINGNFGINQRVVSGTVTLSAGAYGHDRWKAGASGCTYTFATAANVTTITISAGSLVQVIEGLNLQSGTHVLSFTGTVQMTINGGSAGNSGMTGTLTGGTNATVETSGTGTLSLVQLEAGDTATPFEHRSYGQELALCQRYFEKSYNQSVAPGASGQGNNGVVLYIGTGNSVSNGDKLPMVTFMAVKRTAPTILIWSPNGTSNTLANMASSDLAAGSATPNVASDRNFFAYQNSGGSVSGTLGCVQFHYTASAEL
jgi:hypothetical protein